MSIDFTLRSVKIWNMKKEAPPAVRRGRPPSEMAASHDIIMDAVYALLEEKSVRDLTIEAVAKRAGVGKPTLYKWWPTKATLVLAMLCEHGAEIGEADRPDRGTVPAVSSAELDRRVQRAVWQDRGRADRRGPERTGRSPGVL